MTHKDLVEIAYKWVLHEAGCSIAFREFMHEQLSEHYPDVIGVGSFGKSIAVKVDVSRHYYLQTIRKENWQDPNKSMGRYRFLCVPTDLIKPEELPHNWGLIYVNKDGKAACVHNPYSNNLQTFWKNGFEDYNLYTLLDQQDPLNTACRRLRYRALIHEK